MTPAWKASAAACYPRRSEIKLQRHLDLPGRTLEEDRLSGAADLSCRCRTDARARCVELRRVEEIEKFRPVFQAACFSLRKTELLEHGKIHLLGPRTVQDIPCSVTKQERSGRLKRRDIEPALQSSLLAGKIAVADAIRALAPGSGAKSVLRR